MTKKAWALVGGAMGLAVVLAVALVVVIATDDDDSDALARPAVPFAPGGLDTDAFQEFRECLSEHGVEPPDPNEGPRRKRVPKRLRRGFAECRDLLPAPPAGARRSPGVPFPVPVPQN
jgi:hypothetical protein